MTTPLQLHPAAEDALAAHVLGCAPEEGCGVLLGQGDEATRFVPLRNVAAAPARAFAFDDAEWLRVARAADAQGLELLAVAHAHVDAPAVPSGVDRAHADAARWLVIAEVREGCVAGLRAWRSTAAGLREGALALLQTRRGPRHPLG